MAEENKYNILIESGADFVLPFTWYDNNGNTYDLTGATIEGQLRETPSSADGYDFICTHNGAGGRITITLPYEITSDISFSYGVYDVFVNMPGGGRKRPLYGEVEVQDHVTKPHDGAFLYMIGATDYETLPTEGITDRLYFVYDERKIYRWNGTNYVGTAVGNGIQKIEFVEHVDDFSDKYRITYDDGTHFDYIVTSKGIDYIEKVGSTGTPKTGVIDQYRIHFNNDTTHDYYVTNGRAFDVKTSYDSTQAYEYLDMVRVNGATYVAVQDVPADTSISDTDYWLLLIAPLAIGSVESVGYDANPEVTITGTADEPLINFRVPRGIPGNESINDTKGEGDTDYVWSADRSYRLTHDKYHTTTGNFALEQGHINSGTGAEAGNTKRGRSPKNIYYDPEVTYIEVIPDTDIYWSGRIYKRSDDSYVGAITDNSDWIHSKGVVYVDPAYKYRFVISNATNTDIDVPNLPEDTLSYVEYRRTDTSLSISGISADAKVTGDKINALNSDNLIWNTMSPEMTEEKRPLVNGHRKIIVSNGAGTVSNHGIRCTCAEDGKNIRVLFGYSATQIQDPTHVPLDGLKAGGTYTLSADVKFKFDAPTTLYLARYEKSIDYKDVSQWDIYSGATVPIMTYAQVDVGTAKKIHWEWTFTFSERAYGYQWDIKVLAADYPLSKVGNFIEFDKIMLVEGNASTAWKPSPFDFIQREEDEIPDIIKFNGDETEVKLQQLNRRTRVSSSTWGNPPFCLLHFSDIHGNGDCLKNIVDFKTYYSQYLDDALCTGDMVSNKISDGMDFWDGVSGAEEILTCIGNHDTRGDVLWIDQTMAESYATYIEPYIDNWGSVSYEEDKTYYYKDYATKKVRLIVLDGMHQTADQLTWFIATLASARQAGYHVICAAHIKPHWQTSRFDTVWDDAPVLPQDSSYVKQNYTDTSGNTGADYPTNFSTSYCDAIENFIGAGGNFVCWLTGHVHYKMFCKVTPVVYSDILIVSAANAGLNANTYVWERVLETKSADDFNVLAVDTTDKILRIAKIGVDYDRLMRHVDTISYNYGTGTLLYSE